MTRKNRISTLVLGASLLGALLGATPATAAEKTKGLPAVLAKNPSNYVDDFGAVEPSTPAAVAATPSAHASLVPLNYIDDFGVQAPEEVTVSTASAPADVATPPRS